MKKILTAVTIWLLLITSVICQATEKVPHAFALPLKKQWTVIRLHFKKLPPTDSLDILIKDGFKFLEEDKVVRAKIIEHELIYKVLLAHPVQIAFLRNQFFLFADSIGRYQSAFAMVEPGDKLDLSIGKDFSKGIFNIKFKGKGAGKFAMIQERAVALKKLVYIDPIKMSLNQEFVHNDSLRKLDSTILRKYRDVMSDKMRMYFALKLLYDENYYTLQKLGSKLTSEKMLQPRIAEMKKTCLNNFLAYDSQLFLILSKIADLEFGISKQQNISQRFTIENPLQHYQNLKNSYPPQISQMLCTYFLYNAIKSKGINDQKQEAVADYLSSDWPDQKMKNDFKRFMVQYDQHTGKSPVLQSSLQDTASISHTLADFKGQVVLVDFYFYGCGGCYTTRPYIDSLEKIYAGKPVKFIGLSVDKDKELWKKGIGKFSSSASLNLYTNGLGAKHSFIKYYGITSYPTIMLIDKSGVVITARAPDVRTKDGWMDMNKILMEEILK